MGATGKDSVPCCVTSKMAMHSPISNSWLITYLHIKKDVLIYIYIYILIKLITKLDDLDSESEFQPMPSVCLCFQCTCMQLKLFIATGTDICRPFKNELMQKWINFERSIADFAIHFPRGWMQHSLTFHRSTFFFVLWGLSCVILCSVADPSDVTPRALCERAVFIWWLVILWLNES